MISMYIFSTLVFLIDLPSMSFSCKTRNDSLGFIVDCSNQNLRNIPEDISIHVNILNLTNNKISKIANGTFQKFTALWHLEINNNLLKILEPASFEGLVSLKCLEMAGNKLNIFDAYSNSLFIPIRNISKLDISRNMPEPTGYEKTFYPDQALGVLTNLEYLAIDLMPNSIFREGFKTMRKLRSVNFKSCYLQTLNNSTFINFYSSVKHLEIKGCRQFVTTDSEALKPFKNLEVLDLENSYFHPIQALQMLQPFRYGNIKHINFRHVNDETIEDDLKYPYLVNITRDMVRHLQTMCIEELDLSDNNIVDFENASLFHFEKPYCIQRLRLSDNRLSFSLGYRFDNIKYFFNVSKNITFFEYSFIPLNIARHVGGDHERLHDIAVSQHRDSNVLHYTIEFPNSLKELLMSHIMSKGLSKKWIFLPKSQIQKLDISYCESDDVIPIPNGSNLRHLDVSGIDVHTILKQIKSLSLNKLKHFVMKDADFYQVYLSNEIFFKYIPNAERVDISSNYLWDLHEDTFSGLKRLTNLSLANNRFRNIPSAIMKASKLRELDMTSNLLTTIEKSMRDFFDELQSSKHGFTLLIGNNAFFCDCSNADFIWWLHNTSTVSFDWNTYKCLLENGSESDTLSVAKNYNTYFASCQLGLWLRVGIALNVLFFMLLVTATIIYNFRWRLAFYFYSRFRKELEKEINIDFKYDIYVFYPGDEIIFVKEVLMRKMEKDWGLTLCIEDRDFPIGDSMADVMSNSISLSRHAILIVSRAFMNDQWSKHALNVTKYHYYTKRLQKIFIITKGISVDEIPTDIADLWKDVAHIDWPHSEDELPNVWNKLKMWLFLNRPFSEGLNKRM